ncbi:MAG: site-specific integrase [Selenomonadaceae bacterium]|nr:site-specific integrase [Selenomonadaceae bacterium]
MKSIRRQHGEGSYDFLESKGVYRWRGYYQDPVTGKNKRKEICAKNRKTLRHKVQKWQENLSSGEINRIKVSAWGKKWINIVKSTTKPTTARNYGVTLRCHIIPQWGSLWLDRITVGMLQDYLNGLADTHSYKTILTIRAHIQVFFSTSIRYGFLAENPAKNLKISKRNLSTKKVLNENEIEKLLKISKEKIYLKEDNASKFLHFCYYVILRVAISTGMRQGELFGLNWGNINFSKNIILIENSLTQIKSANRISDTKTHKSRTVVIDSYTISLLKRWKKFQQAFANSYTGFYENSYNLVFTNSIGRFISSTNFAKRYFRPLLKEAGIDENFHFHGLRHTHASMLLANGVNPQIVSERLGHSSISTTMNIYAHILPNLQDSAKNILEKLFEGE